MHAPRNTPPQGRPAGDEIALPLSTRPTAPRLGLVSLALCMALASAALTGGCASTPSRQNDNARPRYIEDYTAGNYSSALASASAAAKDQSLSDDVRDQAILIAGEAAHALDRNAESKTWLFKVSGAKDPLVRGKAQATLGLIALEEGSMARAAELLSQASDSLMGDEAARASMYAGDAFRATAREADAVKSYKKAAELVRNDASLRGDISERLAGRGPTLTAAPGSSTQGTPTSAGKPPFTLQLAAFSSPQKAHQHVAKVKSQAARLALGAPQVVPVFRSGKILYSVRVGTFASKMDADRAKGSFQGAIVISAKS